jgi:hypothetical protein
LPPPGWSFPHTLLPTWLLSRSGCTAPCNPTENIFNSYLNTYAYGKLSNTMKTSVELTLRNVSWSYTSNISISCKPSSTTKSKVWFQTGFKLSFTTCDQLNDTNSIKTCFYQAVCDCRSIPKSYGSYPSNWNRIKHKHVKYISLILD